MFSVIISEKGGAERRETFDRTEINVGRVQGNDLMLPKGNVSKRHARLLFRDGRFIVTDLKSTNGTYVNGRKIAQATIVREGDKIYIGDFVLRIEAGQGSPSQASSSQPAPALDDLPSDLQSAPPGPSDESAPPPARPAFAAKPPPAPGSAVIPVALSSAIPAPPPIPKQISAPPQPISVADGPRPVLVSSGAVPEPSRGPTPASEAPWLQAGPEAARAPGPSVPAPISPDGPVIRQSGPPGEPPSSSQPSSAAEKALRPPAPRIEPKTGDRDRHEVISHFPLEHDPDESVHFAVPGPPRVPSSPKPLNKTAPSAAMTMGDPGRVPQPPPITTGFPQPPPIRGTAIQPTAPGTPFNLPAPPGLPPQPVAVAPMGETLKPGGGSAPPHSPLDRATSPSVGLAALGIVPPAMLPTARRPAIDASPRNERARSGGPGAEGGPSRAPDPVTGGSTAPTPGAAVQRAALADLIHRVEALADLSALAEGAPPDEALTTRIERALADASAPLRERSDVDLDALLVDARRELCELGPLTPLFDDEDVGEMQVVRHDYVVALHGSRQVAAELGFSSEAAVGRAIRRLCVAAGKPLAEGETFVERRLPRGARLFAVLPRAEDHGHMVVVRKPQRADLSLEDLVRSGTISRAMASLLSQCVAAHANILVAGAAGAGTTTLLGALAGAGSTEDRVVVLQEDDELVFNQPHTVSILLGDKPEERVRAIQAAARIRPDRLVVGAFAGAAAAEMVDAMGNGADGVLAGARAPTLRQAVHRLTADIAATRPGLSPEVTREWLASVFDLAIEVARLRDGRHRVLRVAELAIEGNRVALRDVFTFAVERTAAGGTLEGTFSATGVVPAVLDDIAARGIPVDTSVFRRHARAEAGDGGAQSPRLGNADATPLPRPPTR